MVKRHVGVDPLRQLTGGACFALKVGHGPPAISFPGFLPVFGSDDGFYHSNARNVLVNAELVVERSLPGQPLAGPEYLIRLACAASLATIHRRANLSVRLVPDFDEVVAAGTSFLDELRDSIPNAVPALLYRDARLRLRERAMGLICGYENYIELTHRWSEVCEQVAEMRSTLRHGCGLR